MNITKAEAEQALNELSTLAADKWLPTAKPLATTLRAFIAQAGEDAERTNRVLAAQQVAHHQEVQEQVAKSAADAHRWRTLLDSLPPKCHSHSRMPMLIVPCSLSLGYSAIGLEQAVDAIIAERARSAAVAPTQLGEKS